MNDTEQRLNARAFSQAWQGRGYEKGESQKFWLELLQKVMGVADPFAYISFEDQVHLDHTSFIDAFIPSTKVLIEQKSLGKSLTERIRQSDGSFLSPIQQAKRYITELPVSDHPRWVVTCNFSSFYIYDMEHPWAEPEIVQLEDLEKELHRLDFLVTTDNFHLQREMQVSVAAGNLVGRIYDALRPKYAEPDNEATLRSLNILCVRLVFCLYAEDAGVFDKDAFHHYLVEFPAHQVRKALVELFRVLDTPYAQRDPYLKDDNPRLAAFPYVNGGLFADEMVEIPPFDDELRTLLLDEASLGFDWTPISPTIFGAVFESTLNPLTRRSGGMHYTSIENIHKVIDPLFLIDLKEELFLINQNPDKKKRDARLNAFQSKLASLSFLDPACGSGNFLTETFVSLRRLENEVLRSLRRDQMTLGLEDPIRVNIAQFHGIEINDFAVTVAKTALWIAESQMLKETETIVQTHIDFLPLKTNAFILEANALHTDWNALLNPDGSHSRHFDFIIGNPPFVGYSLQTKSQKEDVLNIYVDEKGKPYKTAGKIDYVACWYYKAAQLMQGTNTRAALVSTNSITQGEQTSAVWRPLFEQFGAHIDFAYRTFRWDSEASLKAHVHCVIVGFSCAKNSKQKLLFDGDTRIAVDNINPYLIAADDVWIESRSKTICDVPVMTTGNRPADGGFLIIEEKDYEEFVKKEPAVKKFIKTLLGSEEFINNKKRYCLWLVGAAPNELRSMPMVMERIEKCKEARLSSPDKGRQKLADTPHLFRETNNPESFLIIPQVSSERRRYVPIGFCDSETIATNLVQIIPNCTLYHFGVLTSSVHMAWMRAVCGRLKSDYRYSKEIVYNNFPWPEAGEKALAKIEQAAQAILDARALYPDSSLADLYDELTMPPELRCAHQANDRAVMEAFGFPVGCTEPQVVARLMALYQKLAGNQ